MRIYISAISRIGSDLSFDSTQTSMRIRMVSESSPNFERILSSPKDERRLLKSVILSFFAEIGFSCGAPYRRFCPLGKRQHVEGEHGAHCA
ncbi:MAG TPA: hypothetical protein VJX95_00300 [Oscillospiraceae bacterium]|nr:hypothetical protein [Oscillospiraceae bacterium]